MRFETVLTAEADSTASEHLLRHYRRDKRQEDLCFALWRPSTGHLRRTALIDEIILPKKGERLLHGNASFEPAYLARAMKIARDKKAGLAFMHSHPSDGWQGMSATDVEAERDVLAYPAGGDQLAVGGIDHRNRRLLECAFLGERGRANAPPLVREGPRCRAAVLQNLF